MKASGVSTVALSQSLRLSLVRAQAELVKAQKEAQTGRAADTGLALGTGTAQSVSFARDLERISGIIDSNSLVSARLKATQDALAQISAAAQSFLSTLMTSSSGDAIGNVTRDSARTTLEALTDILNTSFNGENIFAGINTDVKPLNDYTAPGFTAKASFDAAFLAHFGFTQNDPAAASISVTDMNAFMDTQVEPLFMGAGWATDWSNASDQRIVSRITLTETTQTSVSANQDGFRKLAMAATVIMDLFDSNVGPGARAALVERAVSLVGDAIGGLGDLQATTGIIQQRVANATERLEVQSDLFERRIGNLLDIDPYEAATRVSTLLTQIETSYALTARLQQLSITRFIS
jgi:flagellar hook-associated protein 3 FlgL